MESGDFSWVQFMANLVGLAIRESGDFYLMLANQRQFASNFFAKMSGTLQPSSEGADMLWLKYHIPNRRVKILDAHSALPAINNSISMSL